MGIAFYYNIIFLSIVALLTMMAVGRYRTMNGLCELPTTKDKMGMGLVVAVGLTILIGTRPISYAFIDMMNYHFDYLSYQGETSHFDRETTNLIFDNLLLFMATSGMPEEWFYILMATVNFGCTYAACRKMFPRDSYIAFLVFAAAFSTFSYCTNGIKAGAAAAVFLLALAYKEEKRKAVFLLFLAYGMHHSMILPIAAYIGCWFYDKQKLYFGIWFICLLLAAAHVTAFQELFSSFSDQRTQDLYLGNTKDAYGLEAGFRPDFILYSAIPIIVGYYAIYKRKIQSKYYSFLINTYMLTNAVWMLCMYATFTNRIAYLSWGMYPVVLIYPFLMEQMGPKRYKQLYWVVLGHLCFSFIMYFTGKYH